MTTVTVHSDFGAQEEKYVTTFTFSPSFCCELMEQDAMVLVLCFFFKYLVLRQLFHSPPSPSKGPLAPLHFLPLEWYHLHI